MHAVINQLPLKKPIDQALLDNIERDLKPVVLASPGLQAFHLLRVSDEQAVLVLMFDTLAELEENTRTVGLPWFEKHVKPYLAGPPHRVVGEAVASIQH